MTPNTVTKVTLEPATSAAYENAKSKARKVTAITATVRTVGGLDITIPVQLHSAGKPAKPGDAAIAAQLPSGVSCSEQVQEHILSRVNATIAAWPGRDAAYARAFAALQNYNPALKGSAKSFGMLVLAADADSKVTDEPETPTDGNPTETA